MSLRSKEHAEILAVLEQEATAKAAALVRDVERFFMRFVVLPHCAPLVLALWVIGTYLFQKFASFPYLVLLSPEKGCGKTRTTEVLELAVSKPERAICVSEASLFRLIEAKKPTLILDEAEVLAGKNERAEAVRALLNSGNRAGASVPRCVGASFELKFFSVYCPKVICVIRVCPETVKDRAIVIAMQRKRPTESVERFISRRVGPEGEALRVRLREFCEDERQAIELAYEKLNVEFLSDRDAENFEPLIAILTVADPSRLDELRRSAEFLTAGKLSAAEDDSLSLRLLADLRAVWPNGLTRALTRDLLDRLAKVEGSPWQDEVPLNPRKLARFLSWFGVSPGDVRAGEERAKGYKFEELEEAFSRYLAPIRDKGDNPHG